MSIITDALRKAEDERELKAKRASTVEASRVAVTEAERLSSQTLSESIFSHQVMQHQLANSVKVGKKLTWRLPLHLLAVSFFLLSICIWMFLPNETVPPEVPEIAEVSEAVPDFVPPPQIIEPIYVLSGITNLGNNRYAIINGVILQEGKSIAGAQVKKISDQEVTLVTETGEIKLIIE